GPWTAEIYVKDEAGRSYFGDAPLAAGTPDKLTVISKRDLMAPVIHGFSFTPTVVDVSEAAASVQYSTRITDDLSGVSSTYIQFRNDETRAVIVGSLSRGTGNALDGTYSGSTSIPRHSLPGPWTAEIYVKDEAGRSYFGDAPLAAGTPDKLTVTHESMIPDAATFLDPPGTAADTYTIPSAVGVEYLIRGTVVPPGTYLASGSVTVVARALPLKVISPSATSMWTHTFTSALISAPMPQISGSTKVGSSLTALPGTWTPEPVQLAYQWYRSGQAITDATAKTYVLTGADAGKLITVMVTGTRTGYDSTSRLSSPTTAIANGGLSVPVPTLTGTAMVGSTLTAVPGTWGPAPVVLAYQWKANGVVIAGATAATYKPVAADAGKTLTVTVTGSKSGYTTVSKTSAATAAVAKGSLVTATPTITGTAKVGSALTAVPGAWGPSPVALAYQWYRSGVAITGSTAATRILNSYDTGKTLTVRVTGSKSGYTTVSKASAPTAAVAKGSLVTATPTITGTAKVGSVLTANPGTWGPSPVTLRYQWYRSGVAITGSTAATRTLNSYDTGKTLTVRATGSKSGYTTVSKTSAPTTKIAN
ncbi:hypothetical protein M2428_004295, partial [Arthrobacter sp. ES3-54]|nr:hypothetical protein [Arthrobacter sp. ES3-54]